MKIPKISTINIKKLRLRAYIGFQDWEREKLQDVIISFSFTYNTRKASETDQVEDAVDYKKLTKQIIALVDNKHFFLVENLAEQIYQHIVSYDKRIEEINVVLEKPYALRFTDNVVVRIDGADRYKEAVIALGSNINPEENFEKALKMLADLGTIVQRTEFIKTPPLKFTDQADFLNGAVLLLTRISLSELQLQLKQIEAFLGRVRTDNKNAPRTIDLDVTAYRKHIVDDEIEELPFLIDFVKYLQPEITVP